MAEKPEVNRSQAIRDYFTASPNATTQEVVDALAKQAIMVTDNLVRTIKFQHNKRQAAKRAAKAPATKQAAEATTTAKQPEVNKTQAVREYLKVHKRAKTSEVVKALGEQGITVSATYVSSIKGKRKTRRRAVKEVVAAVAPTGIGVPEIKAAMTFLKTVGSMSAAKQALAAAEEIRKVV